MSDQTLGQVLEKPCVRSRDYIFCPIIMKLGENVCLDEISYVLENGSCIRSKSRSPGRILEKSYVYSRGHIFSPIIMKLDQHVCLDKILDEFENRSLGQILENLVYVLETSF